MPSLAAANSTAPYTLTQVTTLQERKTFIRAGAPALAGDPNYIAPLAFEVEARLNPAANPTLKNAEHALWIAYKDGMPVGRIAALINQDHLVRHHDQTGHFGFLDAIDDPALFALLLQTAETWLREKGMHHIAGPYNLSVNEECGLLIDGFDTPPYVMMPHNRPYYQPYIEQAGYEKAQDMHALRYKNIKQFIPEKRQRFVEKVLSDPSVTIRNLNFKTFNEDIKTLVGIFNDAWSENWGFIPFTDDHANHMTKELRPIITTENVVLCYKNDVPVSFALVLPNINEAIRDFDGKLLPFNWAKLLYRLKIKGLSSARMPLMGVVKKYQGKPLGVALAYKMIDMANSANIDKGVTESELSWILEDNHAMLNMLIDMGSEVYKTYRIYKKAL